MTKRVDLGLVVGTRPTPHLQIMTGTDHTAPFDQAHDHRSGEDLAATFWGDDPSWRRRSNGATRAPAGSSDDTTGTMRAVRDGVAAFRPQRIELRDATGQVRRTRSHGIATPSTADRRAKASIGDLAAGHYDEPSHDDVPLSAAPTGRVGLGAVDPLLVRFGALLLVGVLLVPLALALRPSSSDSVRIEGSSAVPVAAAVGEPAGAAPAADGSAAEPLSSEAANAPAASTTTGSDAAPAASAGADDVSAADVGAPAEATSGVAESDASVDAGDITETAEIVDAPAAEVTQAVGGGIDDAATVDATAERIVPECPQTYTAAPGDSWYGIADAAGVTPSAVLGENNATVDTVIFPGDEICLPSEATIPAPPETTAPPASTTTPTSAPTTASTTTAPSTTVAPPTTAPAGSPGRDASVDEVKAVIRSVFPESEWETAYTIVERESRFDPTAYNGWCCYGVFQIYWNVHRSWLDDLGIDSSDDLFDPLLNTRAAYEIWQRAGNSWTPWSTYDG